MIIDAPIDEEVPAACAEPRDVASPNGAGLRSAVRHAVLTLFDQSAVSGVRFLTTVIVGRACGPEELGIYTLGFAVLVVFSAALESLIFTPLVVYGSRLQGTAQRVYWGSVLGIAVLVAVATAVSLGALGLLLMGVSAPGFAALLGILTLAGPAILAWEFCRWFSLAHRRLDQAIVVDVGVAVFQSGMVLGLATTGTLSAATAYLAIAAVCAVNAGCWLYRSRSSFVLRQARVLPVLTRHWSLARWIFASRVTYGAINPVIFWILASWGNAAEVGQLSACMTVIFLYNPILLGINNFFFPRAVDALHRGGRAGLRRTVWKNTWIWAGGLALIAAPMIVIGQQMVQWIYGNAYAGHQVTIVFLALVAPAAAWMIVSYGGLSALERTDLTFAATGAAMAGSAGVSAVLVPQWGIDGAACAVLACPIVAAVLATAVFQAATRPPAVEPNDKDHQTFRCPTSAATQVDARTP
jgi:O-antigen/teichoic acid export membrane protein